MSATPAQLRDATRLALRRMAKSVCVVSTVHDGQRFAMSATATDVVSLDPPSMVVSVNQQASLHPVLTQGADFCINVLSRGQEAVARGAGGELRGEERFTRGRWSMSAAGVPWLDDAEANIVCRAASTLRFGTHELFVGEVTEVRVAGHAIDPLVYLDGRYVGVEPTGAPSR